MTSPPSKTPPATLTLAVAVIASAMLLVEVMVTRLFSVAFFHHYSFFAVSLIMTGLALGGVAVSRWNVRDSSAETFANRLALLAWIFAGSTIFASLRLSQTSTQSVQLELLSVAAQALVFLPGLVAAGAFLAAAFSRKEAWIDRLYAADLTAAAGACVVAIYLMRTLQGTATLLAPAALAAGAAALLTRQRSLRTVYLLTAVVAIVGMAAGIATKGDFLRLATGEYIFERWNEHSRIVVRKEASKQNQHLILIDRSAATPLRRINERQARGEEPIYPNWRKSANYMAYMLGRRLPRVAVIGVGGGDDLTPPLTLGAAKVDGYELNRIMIDILEEEFRDFNALTSRQELELIHAEARVGILHSGREYDLIQASLIDTWAATASGGFLLSENGLYTTEGWEIFLNALSERGILTMTRWFVSSAPAETQRLVALAAQALERVGVEEPSNHLLLVAQELPKVKWLASEGRVLLATILISKQPFSESELKKFYFASRTHGFIPLAAPGTARDPVIERLLDHDRRAAAIKESPYDISPPSDERPYFFLQLRPADVLALRGRDYGPITEITLNGVRVLVVLTVLAVAFAALVLALAGLTLPSATSSTGERTVYRSMSLYFFGIGAGYILIQLGLHQRLILILGHPTLVLSVVLFWMLIGTGAGAFCSRRLFSSDHIHRAWYWILAALTVLLVGFPRLDLLESIASAPIRAVGAGLLLAGVGFLLGFAFPIGVGIVGTTGEWAVQKMWAVNGAASIAASAVAAVIGISFGSRAVILAGLLCYAVMAVAGLAALRARRAMPA
ncbi:MAG: hypothetical protein ACE5GX_09540 [Thermoanaerobaculia bacterium]